MGSSVGLVGSWRSLAAGIVLIGAFLPFLNKPFHIDDPVFLDIARAIRFPAGAESGYRFRHMGTEVESFNPYLTTHPPGVPYLMKAIAGLAGDYSELPLHASFLVFPALLVVGTRILASRVGAEPWPAALCVVANGALLPSAHSVMADVPAMALWTASSAAILGLTVLERGARLRVIVAAAGLVLACLCAYQILLLVPLLLLFASRGSGGRQASKLVGLVLFPAAVLVGLAAALSIAGWQPLEGPISQIRAGWATERLVGKLASIPIYCGLAFLPFLPWCVAGMRRSPATLGVAGLAAAAEATFLARAGYSAGEIAWLALLAFAGVVTLGAAASAARALPDRPVAVFLLGSAVVVVGYNLLLLPFGAARYLMPLIPPVVVLLARSLPSARVQLMTGMVTAAIGIGVATGDYVLASSYRDFARQAAQTVGVPRDRVWFVGEWGMNYYMSAAGFRYLTAASNDPVAGDLVVFAEVPRLWNASPTVRDRLQLIDVREVRSSYPIRVMSTAARAGYYSHLWGYHPVTLSSAPVERFGVFRVIR